VYFVCVGVDVIVIVVVIGFYWVAALPTLRLCVLAPLR
jgi:hypothetical protein